MKHMTTMEASGLLDDMGARHALEGTPAQLEGVLAEDQMAGAIEAQERALAAGLPPAIIEAVRAGSTPAELRAFCEQYAAQAVVSPTLTAQEVARLVLAHMERRQIREASVATRQTGDTPALPPVKALPSVTKCPKCGAEFSHPTASTAAEAAMREARHMVPSILEALKADPASVGEIIAAHLARLDGLLKYLSDTIATASAQDDAHARDALAAQETELLKLKQQFVLALAAMATDAPAPAEPTPPAAPPAPPVPEAQRPARGVWHKGVFYGADPAMETHTPAEWQARRQLETLAG